VGEAGQQAEKEEAAAEEEAHERARAAAEAQAARLAQSDPSLGSCLEPPQPHAAGGAAAGADCEVGLYAAALKTPELAISLALDRPRRCRCVEIAVYIVSRRA
jgi:hypothetical protein